MNLLGAPTHVLLLESIEPFADFGFDLSLSLHDSGHRFACAAVERNARLILTLNCHRQQPPRAASWGLHVGFNVDRYAGGATVCPEKAPVSLLTCTAVLD